MEHRRLKTSKIRKSTKLGKQNLNIEFRTKKKASEYLEAEHRQFEIGNMSMENFISKFRTFQFSPIWISSIFAQLVRVHVFNICQLCIQCNAYYFVQAEDTEQREEERAER